MWLVIIPGSVNLSSSFGFTLERGSSILSQRANVGPATVDNMEKSTLETIKFENKVTATSVCLLSQTG